MQYNKMTEVKINKKAVKQNIRGETELKINEYNRN